MFLRLELLVEEVARTTMSKLSTVKSSSLEMKIATTVLHAESASDDAFLFT